MREVCLLRYRLAHAQECATRVSAKFKVWQGFLFAPSSFPLHQPHKTTAMFGRSSDLLKEGTRHMQGLDEAVMRNIEAIRDLSKIVRTSMGPHGMLL